MSWILAPATDEVVKGLTRIVARIGPVSALRVVRNVFVLVGLLLLAVGFSPVVKDASEVAEENATSWRPLLVNFVGQEKALVRVPVTEFVSLRMIFTDVKRRDPSGQAEGTYSASFVIEWQNVILVLGLFSILWYMLFYFERAMAGEQRFAHLVADARNAPQLGAAILDQAPEELHTPPLPGSRLPLSAEQSLSADVALASTRASELFSRSTIMLFAGITIAFVGVTIFYFYSDPLRGLYGVGLYGGADDVVDRGPVSVSQGWVGGVSDVMARLRPTFILVFFETVAWFLLRQYRVLIEDYKYFYRIYLKRQNYLVALLALKELPPKSPQLLAITAMLQEDLSGRLAKGQKTETAEQLGYLDQNPIFQILETVLKHVGDVPGRRGGGEHAPEKRTE